MGCSDCGLHVHSSPTCIPGSGSNKSDIMIIASYANDLDEDNAKATMSPQLLQFMERFNIDPNGVYYTNAIKCRAPRGTKYKVGDIKKCSKHLQDEIDKVKPKYILLIGAQAVKATIGGSITSLNGVTVEKDGIKYIPTYSPGVVFRDPGKAPFVDQALGNFGNLIKGKTRKLPKLNVKVLTSMRDVRKAFDYLDEMEYRSVSYDIEATGLSRFDDEITLFGFGNKKVQYVIPLEVKYSPLRGMKIAQKKIMVYVINQLNTRINHKIASNGKFDNLFLEYKFGKKPILTFDDMLASHCLNENTPNGAKENAILECNALNWDIDLDHKKGNIQSKKMYDEYIQYLGYDIYFEYDLFLIFKKRLRSDKAMNKLFFELYMPVIRAYEEIEKNGVYVYIEQFKEARKHLKKELAKVEKKLAKHAGKGMNWGSTQQVAELLYGKLKLPVLEMTDGGNPSTSEATLMQLRDKHKVVELILQYRGIKIQISHFIDGWINRMQKGKLHPNFKLNGTVTGRTSCTNPNLQQVPRDPKIRSLIGARPGRTFVEADLSQAELRIAAIMSGDEAMLRIYQTGGDIHTSTYEIVSGEKMSGDKYEVKEKRKKAKAVNFGFLYGMGWKKFKDYARDTYGLKLTDKEAKEYRERFFEVYESLPNWHNKQRRIAKAFGEVRNPIGRLRRLPDVYSSDGGKVAEAQRQSINSPVQGFGSDWTLLGMAEVLGYASVYNEGLVLDQSRFSCVGTVHDATLFEVDNEYLEEFIPKVKAIMENPRVISEVFNFESPIPIVVDVAVGKSWSSGVELDLDNNDWKEYIRGYVDQEFKYLHTA